MGPATVWSLRVSPLMSSPRFFCLANHSTSASLLSCPSSSLDPLVGTSPRGSDSVPLAIPLAMLDRQHITRRSPGIIESYGAISKNVRHDGSSAERLVNTL